MAGRTWIASLRANGAILGLCSAIFLPNLAVAQAQISGSTVAARSAPITASAAGENCSLHVPDRASLSRERLVLNGAPSALERIRMEQKTAETAAFQAEAKPQPQSILMRSLANRPVAASMAPASRGALSLGEVRPQSVEEGCKADDLRGFADAFGADRADLLDHMGTRPILVRRTAFDQRWERVRRAPSAALMRSALQQSGVVEGMDKTELLARVNRWVNQKIAYQSDDRNYGERDYWASAAETLQRLSGDCEDYAILKMHMLQAAGISADRIKLMLLRDLAGNRDHAFLVVSMPGGDQVLDNMADHIYAARAAVAVRPVLSFSENRRWVHAFRDQPQRDAAFETVPAAATL